MNGSGSFFAGSSFALFSGFYESILTMISALERVDDNGYFELCYNFQVAQEHGQMEIQKSPPSPGSFPPEGFCDFLGYLGVNAEDD